jgi:hypothetical protein
MVRDDVRKRFHLANHPAGRRTDALGRRARSGRRQAETEVYWYGRREFFFCDSGGYASSS